MRYPLPYAFARAQQVLLEEDAQGLTLHVQALSLPAGIAEALRKVAVPDGHRFDVSWITHRESREPELGHRIRLRVSGFTDRGARAGRALDDDPVTYHPTTAPGARLPSVFLRDGTSLHEHLGQWFTVLVLGW